MKRLGSISTLAGASSLVAGLLLQSMNHVPNFTSDDRVAAREGLVVGFTIGTESQNYDGWNSDAQALDTITYVQESDVKGVKALEFAASSGPDAISSSSSRFTLDR